MTDLGQTKILLGAQWGDEGKGRVTDMLAATAGVIARSSGGMNAGHTVIVGAEQFELHLIPSGILHSEKKNIIANGTVVHPPSLVGEMEGLEARGLSMNNLFISDAAHVVMPYHLLLDRLEEERKGDQKIGTTKKGIGPAYTDKAARRGIRMGDLLDLDEFRTKLARNLAYTNLLLTEIYKSKPLTVDAIVEEYQPFIERLRPHITDTAVMLEKARKAGEEILFEGAQGTLLDLDHGTYPFVTSSNPTAGGVCTGSGIGPTCIDSVLGVTKAYLTRVGAGPFPTELDDDLGSRLQQQGGEIGVTTGRPRRCGWFDVPIAKFAARINGLTHLALTKLDVLSGFESISICTHYLLDGETIEELPTSARLLDKLEPVYEEMPGWTEDISSARTFEELPTTAQNYVQRLEELCGVPVAIICIGPGREQAILR